MEGRMTFQACSKPFFTRAALEMHSSSPVFDEPARLDAFGFYCFRQPFDRSSLDFLQPHLWKIAIGGMN
jgi:hypothetical protein